MATALGTVELSSHLLKQQQQQPLAPQSQQGPQPPLYQEELNGEYLQRTSMPAMTTGGVAGVTDQGQGVVDGSTTFSDPLSHFTDFFSATLKEEQRLDEILMDNPLSPFGTDPLLSAGSPDASKDSSHRSSFSSDDDDLCSLTPTRPHGDPLSKVKRHRAVGHPHKLVRGFVPAQHQQHIRFY